MCVLFRFLMQLYSSPSTEGGGYYTHNRKKNNQSH